MSSSGRKPRRRLWIIILLSMLVAGAFLGVTALERAVLERSERMMARVCGPGSRITIGQVDMDLLPGNIRWKDLRVEQDQDSADTLSDRAMRVSGTVDEVSVRGLSLWRLLFARTLSMRSLAIVHPHLQAFLRTDTADLRPVEGNEAVIISALNVDSVVVDGAILELHRASDSIDVAIGTMSFHVTALRSRWPVDKPFELHLGSALGRIRDVQVILGPLYELDAAEIALDNDGRSFRITNATVCPLRGPQEYDRLVHYETDLFDAHVDTLLMDGFDIAALVNTRTLSTTMIRIAGVDLDVFRDKTMPDAPFKYKPLPARLLRELPVALNMDSLVLDRWNVVYHEKNTLTPDFGEVAFNDLHASVHGLGSADSLITDTVVVRATATGLDRAEVSFELRTVVADSSDRFTVDAKIGRLPFGAFNRMTTDLILVRATAGTIGAVHLTMNASDERATGRVDMEYNGLELELIKRDGSGKPRRFLSDMLNQVVRGHNLRTDPNFRHGDYVIERRQDRSTFNYLWSALREGMIITVLPGVVDEVRQQAGIGKKDRP